MNHKELKNRLQRTYSKIQRAETEITNLIAELDKEQYQEANKRIEEKQYD